ncbi:auxin-responsive protein IAA13-like isoform X2 [Prosopis cineraria]|uniref:auxin-responsive protein IAA13-like isoform X2 n=1 Tax=Prosopis cineraria TaxID=364024 RepID=UPI002410672D|nr:auxin-responsive protein IAA13-like isoform X2 [Prosopis cineraria]
MTLGLLVGGGGNGGSSGATPNESAVSNAKVLVQECSSSYKGEAELELGLGLSLGGRGGGGVGKAKPSSAWGECGRILTAKDFPSGVSHGPSVAASRFSDRVSTVGGSVSGTKRAADSVSHDAGSPTAGSQVVGWPPIRAYRMNSLINQAKAQRAEEDKSSGDKNNLDDASVAKTGTCNMTEKNHLGFVKVNVDGIRIGRKVDLNSHSSYESLAQTLEDMFFKPASAAKSAAGSEKEPGTKASKLLDETSEFVLTYEDKEGDWMLVGDVPWRMFLSSVRRLRIMRTSEANGLAPRYQEKHERLRIKPI